jgi:hypothetical protein
MDKRIKKSLEAAIAGYANVAGLDTGNLVAELENAFSLEAGFMDKVAALDNAIDEAPRFDALREILVDLLFINFFSEDVKKLEEDYLESPEWEQIEEDTLDRGTELLNLLLYLKECQDEDIEPSLEDYLREFLLVDEDEFQDEHRIYEPVIANQALLDGSIKDIAAAAAKINEDAEIKELFYPLMGFFFQPSPGKEEFEQYLRDSGDKAFDAAVYRLLVAYNQ